VQVQKWTCLSRLHDRIASRWAEAQRRRDAFAPGCGRQPKSPAVYLQMLDVGEVMMANRLQEWPIRIAQHTKALSYHYGFERATDAVRRPLGAG